MFTEQKILDQLNIQNNSELCRILKSNFQNKNSEITFRNGNINIKFDNTHNYYIISGNVSTKSKFFKLKDGIKQKNSEYEKGNNKIIEKRKAQFLKDMESKNYKKYKDYKDYCHKGHLIGRRFRHYIDNNKFNFSKNNPKNIYPQWINANDNNFNNSGILGQAYFEEKVVNWLDNGNEVLYKVVPIFKNDTDLYPIGNVIIAAKENAKIIDASGNYLSYVFDEEQIDQFCVFIPNYLDTDVVVIKKKKGYIMNNMKRDGEDVINKGYWYIPKNDISEIDGISYRDIKEISQLQIDINDNDGNFDDYLASLILELPYIQSVSKLYRDNKDEYGLEEKLQRLDNIDKIHNDIVFIKKLFYKGLYHLNKLKENINSEQNFEENEDIFDYIDFYYFFYNEFYRFWYMYRFDLRNIFGINILLEYDDFVERYLKNRFGNLSVDDVNNLINVWVAVFCIELNIKTATTDPEYIFGNNILKNNIDAVELELGSKQIQCCLCYKIFNKKSYEDFIAKTPRIFRFVSYLTRNKKLDKEYFNQNSRRCYSQMWIDGCETQYFALSCGPFIEKEMKYYKTAEEILNSFQNHSKYESVLCTDEMRYYYSNQENDYVTYSGVKSNQVGLPLAIMFSCCERKLLTIIEKYNNKEFLSHKTVHMCIKYSPCQICDRGLNAYEKKGVKFEIIAPGNRMDKNKFSKIDKTIKDILAQKVDY